MSGLRGNVFPQFAGPISRMLEYFPPPNSSSVQMTSAKTYALILFLRMIHFVMLNKAFCGILLHSSSSWMKIFFACGSAIDRLEGLVPVPISMSWRLAFGKHTLVCLRWKSSDHPGHLKHVHLQGLTALFHSIFPNFQWCLSHQFYSGVYVCRISIFFFYFNCNLFWTMLFHQGFFCFRNLRSSDWIKTRVDMNLHCPLFWHIYRYLVLIRVTKVYTYIILG